MQRHRHGFSLMEMLLALLVVALVTMSYFMLQQRNKEVDTAKDLGYRLFEYGQALGDYIRTEGRSFPASGPGVLTYDGYTWLQEKGYLSNDFTLIVEPLYVENIPETDPPAQIRTEITVQENPNQQGNYDLVLNYVLVGPVYSRNDIVYDEEGNATMTQDMSLVARAVNYANEYRDTLKGSGIIQYERIESTVDGQAVSLIEGHTVDQNMWNDAWLLRSGANTMQGPIKFETSEPSDSKISELSNITFAEGGWAAINNVQVINFTGAASLSMPKSITFGYEGVINELKTLNFADGGLINNIKEIHFAEGGRINNIDRIRFLDPMTKAVSDFYGIDNIRLGERLNGEQQKDLGIPFANNFCALQEVHVPENGGGCALYLGTSAHPNNYVLHVQKGRNANSGGSGVYCRVICFQF